jgi:hypothetical protein
MQTQPASERGTTLNRIHESTAIKTHVGLLASPTSADLGCAGSRLQLFIGFALASVYACIAWAIVGRLQSDPYDIVSALVVVFVPVGLFAAVVWLFNLRPLARGAVLGLVVGLVVDILLGLLS